MTIDNLKNTLKDLHARLEAADAADEELRDLLQTLDRDIQNLLNKQEDDESTLAQHARELSAKLAAQHPQLEGILRQLTVTLESMGI